MTVLDAYAVLAYLRDEPAAEQVRPLLDASNADANNLDASTAVLTAVGLAEVLDHLIRLVGVDEEDAVLDVAELGLLDAVAVDSMIGAASGRLRARRYHRTRCAIGMADVIAAETARIREEPLATSDPHLLDVCHIEGIDVIVLAGSDGSRWSRPG